MPDGNATRFFFVKTDPIVTENLSAKEIGKVKVWQKKLTEYEFEFHPMHTTGWPIYVRPVGNADTSNIPKMDTKNVVSGPTGLEANVFTNGPKLKKALSTAAQAELLDIIAKEWAMLKVLAERYWTDASPPIEADKRADMICDKCRTRVTGDFPLTVNEYGKYTCPTCKKGSLKPVM